MWSGEPQTPRVLTLVACSFTESYYFFLISVTVTHTILDAIFTNWYLPASCVDYTGTDL